jgi:hypothetical protein
MPAILYRVPPKLTLPTSVELVARDVEDPSNILQHFYFPFSLQYIHAISSLLPSFTYHQPHSSKMPPQTPDITLYFLQSSRSIRIAWLLEELKLPYRSIFFPRENNKAPGDFKEKSGNTLGKAPSLRDGEVVVWESGAISEYVFILFSFYFGVSGERAKGKRERERC